MQISTIRRLREGTAPFGVWARWNQVFIGALTLRYPEDGELMQVLLAEDPDP